MADYYLISVPASGVCSAVAVETRTPEDAVFAAMLGTDVTERLRVSVHPKVLPENEVLCYRIDARGGEKELPANFCGTCFYHTGCPIFGDLLLEICAAADPEGQSRAMTAAEAEAVLAWLKAEFSVQISPI